MAKNKERADVLLVGRGLAESRARAQALILAGQVYSGEARVQKAGQELSLEAPLESKEKRFYITTIYSNSRTYFHIK